MTRLPLEGVRVLDFCVVWAGPFTTMLLGDLGAEVIKVENPYRFPPSTRGTMAHPAKGSLRHLDASAAGYPNNDPGPRPWNYTPTFVQLYRNKKSVTVDWGRPEGKDIVRQLVATADVVVENNVPGTLEAMGLDPAWMREVRPDLIVARLPAYGLSGPYARARAMGVHLEAVIGHTLLRGYPDHDPSANRATYSADYLAGTQAAFAVMLALWHRKKTGRGQLVEVSQAENAAGMLFQALMDYTLNGNIQTRRGNASVYDAAPCGVYPCRSPGTAADGGDHWIAITVTSDDEWAALRRVMGEPEWSLAPELATRAGRAAASASGGLDARLAAWARDFDDYDLFHRLQAARVPAAPVLQASRVFDDPHVIARGLFQPLELFDKIGRFRFMTPFYRFSNVPVPIYQPPVAFGEHNEYVYREVLGVSEAEYERLEQAGHIKLEYDDSVP